MMKMETDLFQDFKVEVLPDTINRLSFGNSKIQGQAIKYGFRVGTSFDILAGETCPSADICKAKVIHNKKGQARIEVGKNAKLLCFMAAAEARWKNVYEMHKRNTEWCYSNPKDFVSTLRNQIVASGTTLHRWHSSGDFYDWHYFQNIYEIVESMPEVYFYAYTKRATFYNWYLENALRNFDMIYSFGGTEDKTAIKYNLPTAYVILDVKKYKNSKFTDEGLPIACRPENKYDDIEYIRRQENFGLLKH
jgi:hypothetical protein